MMHQSTHQTAVRLLGGAVAATMLLTSCGSSEATDPTETTPIETDSAEGTTPETNSEPTADGQVIIQDIVFDIPEGWTSVNKGEDIETALTKTNPEILATLQANSQLDQLRTLATAVDWLGIPPSGGSVNIVYAPGDEAETPVSEVAAGVKTGAESRGFTVTSEEAFTSPIGDGVRITFDITSPSGEPGAAESVVMRIEERLVLLTSDALTPDEAENQLNLIIESAEIRS